MVAACRPTIGRSHGSRAVIERLPDPDGFVPLGERAIKGRAAVEVYGWRTAPSHGDRLFDKGA